MWLNPDSLRRWMRPGDSDVVHIELNPVIGEPFGLIRRPRTEASSFTQVNIWKFNAQKNSYLRGILLYLGISRRK